MNYYSISGLSDHQSKKSVPCPVVMEFPEIGCFLLVFASFFIGFGALAFFDRGLLAIGNVSVAF